MRVLLSTYGSRGDVEPLAGLAVRLQALGAQVRMCAPPDCAQRLAEAGVPLVPVGEPMRHGQGVAPLSATDVRGQAAMIMAEQFSKLPAAAQGCDAVLAATAMFPVAASVQSVAEKLGIPYVLAAYCPIFQPSPQALDDLEIDRCNALFGVALNTNRASIGLPPVDNVRDHVIGDHLWLAADPVLAPWHEPAQVGVVQTGAWFLPDERPLPAGLEAFLEAGTPPVYVGFGSTRAPRGLARVAIGAIRAQGRRVVVSSGWAGLSVIDDRNDCFGVGEVNQQALFGRVAAVVHHGGAGTTTTAARAGAPQVVIPQSMDQPYWAGRVADLGIGAAHDGPTPTIGSLSAALRAALAPETRARATEVAGMIRTDGTTVAARLLAGVAGARTRGAPVTTGGS